MFRTVMTIPPKYTKHAITKNKHIKKCYDVKLNRFNNNPDKPWSYELLKKQLNDFLNKEVPNNLYK